MADNPASSSAIAAAFQRMTDRERKLVMLTASVAVVLVVAGLGWSLSSSLSRREKGIATRKEEIAVLESLRGDYEAAVARQQQAESRIKSAATTSLFTLMQKAAGDVGLPLSDLNERRIPVKDSDLTEITVDVTLKDISIDKLVTLLENIEGKNTSGVVKVTKLKVKTRLEAPDMLEVNLTVSTWRAPTSGEGGKP
jgi:hypothetical protein